MTDYIAKACNICLQNNKNTFLREPSDHNYHILSNANNSH